VAGETTVVTSIYRVQGVEKGKTARPAGAIHRRLGSPRKQLGMHRYASDPDDSALKARLVSTTRGETQITFWAFGESVAPAML
jgi:hypothetical protein